LDLLEDNGGKAYMAVATRSFTDARIVEGGGVKKEMEVMAAVPVDKVAAAATQGALPAKTLPNPEVSARQAQEAGWAGSYTEGGERIFQVEYRIIKARKPGFLGFGRVPATVQFGDIAGVEAGSGTFHGGSKPVIYEDSEEEEDDIDGDIDEDVGISEEDLTDDSVGQFGTLLVTVDEE